MDEKKDKEDLRAYRTGPTTVLELMTVLAVLGILLNWVLRHFF